jgi:hypothetical protein
MDKETAERITFSARGRNIFSPRMKGDPLTYQPMVVGKIHTRSTLHPNPRETEAVETEEAEAD